ncbi:glycoside hydrolase/deacetylase [Wallemia mellicola]|nr:glycoside hydrolase/deacetylase [Wallemia mellicola]TIC58952.1 glycoside hydrolase/deacetylase [Wallemia mellicola]
MFKKLAYLSILGLAVAQSSVTDEASAAKSTDTATECKAYSAPIVKDVQDKFPTIWQPATIVDGDDEAQAKFDEIKQVLPSNIKPKGTMSGDFSDVTPTYDKSDPDCWYTFNKCTKPKIEGLSEDLADLPEPETWGLGFDDGPNCSHNKFYNFLQENKLTATMFYIGSNVMNWPYQAQRGRDDGHQLCVHTWSHHYMTSFDDEGAFAELYYSIQAVKQVTGVTPTCWRPPFGDVDDRIRLIAEGLGLRTALWRYDSNDWRVGATTGAVSKEDVEKNYEDVINAAKNGTFKEEGTIMLTHEITGETMDIFMDMYPKIKDAFKYVAPFYAATNTTNLYVETGDDVKQGETFSEYVKNVYGDDVEAASTTNTNSHPNPTVTGTQGPLATIANPTVASVEGAAASDVTGDGDSGAFSFASFYPVVTISTLMVATLFVAL